MHFNLSLENHKNSEKIAQIISKKDLANLKDFLSQKKKIIIFAHANPDGDTLGGALGVYEAFKNAGQDITMACYDPVPQKYKFLKRSEEVVNQFDETQYDAFIYVDCGNKKMVKFQEEKPLILSDKVIKINIDHHASNDHFGDINFVPLNVCSSTEVVYRLLQQLDYAITPSIATALLLGVYTDTGSYMHQNTTPESYQIGSELLGLGANLAKISKNVFRSYEFKVLKLWGKVLKELHVTPDGAAIVGIKKEDYENIGCSRTDLEGVIDFVNSIPEVQYSVLLSEDEKGNVKASLRTRKENIDVKALAEKYGGGGHVKAAGFTIPKGHLEKEVKWKIVTEEKIKN